MSPFGKRLFIYPSLRCLSPGNFPLTGDLQSRRHTCIDLRKRRANLLKSEPIPSYQAKTAANLQLDSIVQSIRYLPTETPGYDSTLSYHSLEIPKGGEYRLQLADGSRIWLNSESSLRYPVKFGLHRREIFLSGEIYLEVVPDTQRPFIVHTANRTIKVLGTRFNVRNYPTDSLGVRL